MNIYPLCIVTSSTDFYPLATDSASVDHCTRF